ncbi:MAG: hypothetical protein EOO38_01805 [Cytophagaceae bacterium]|nr:MAG: hypothetical protein EOO38_01805 [Cytophagaceae bacterium]
MAVVDLSVVVTNLATVMTLFDYIRVYRSTTGSVGPYVQITTPATSIPLQAGRVTYDFVDPSGGPSYYYKTSYYSTAKAVESSLSNAFQGAGDSALSFYSVAELKQNYLIGIDTTDTQGREFPEAFYEYYIKSAVSYIEDALDIPLRPTAIVNEKHDYYAADQREYMWTQLYKFPVQSVQQFRLQLPGSAPIIFPNEWIDCTNTTGVIEVLPSNNASFGYNITPVPSGYAGGYSTYQSRSRIPSAIRVDYTAGFLPGECPADLKEVVGMTASFGPFACYGDLIGGAGIASQSLGIDGLSSSINTTSSAMNSGFSGRTLLYERALKERLPILRQKYKGIPLAIA